MKIKVALCYNVLVEKLGSRLKQFSQCEKLVQQVANFLSEGSLEVRN